MAVDEIGADPLGLRPKPRDRVGNATIKPDAVDCDPTLPIKALSVRKRYEFPNFRRSFATGQFGPAIKQKWPFVMMARLQDLTLYSANGRPIGSEEFTQRGGIAINETIEAQRSNLICHIAPHWIWINDQPSEHSLEQMHVRIGTQHQAAVTVFAKSGRWMREVAP